MFFFPWFLLSLVSTLARSYSVSRQQPLDWNTENPSCDQLRDFWTAVRRTVVKLGPETNEIPLLPPLNAAHYERILNRGLPAAVGRHGKTYRKHDAGTYLSHLGLSKGSAVFQAPISPQLPLLVLPKPETPPEGNGIFGEFQEQIPDNSISSINQRFSGISGSPLSVPLGDKKNDEMDSGFYAPQWGSPSEVDSFGNFVDLDIRLLPPQRHLAVTRTPKEVKAGTWSDIIPAEENQTNLQMCDIVVHSTCSVNEHCHCRGWKKLKCVDGKCLNIIQSDELEDKYGTWHDGPIPQTQLRFLPIPRKGHRSVFM